MAAKKSHILLACVQDGYTRLFAILTGHELTFVTTLADAQTALRADRFNMIMIGVNFDESRMFDLLQYVRADSKYTRVVTAEQLLATLRARFGPAQSP